MSGWISPSSGSPPTIGTSTSENNKRFCLACGGVCGLWCASTLSLKTAHRTAFTRLRRALRLKRGRAASRLKALPRAPRFGSSSNSLHPPPAAVVLVTPSNPLSSALKEKSPSTLKGTWGFLAEDKYRQKEKAFLPRLLRRVRSMVRINALPKNVTP